MRDVIRDVLVSGNVPIQMIYSDQVSMQASFYFCSYLSVDVLLQHFN